MSRPLFLRIVDAVGSHDKYFTQRWDVIGKKRLSPIQKVTAVFRMLAYGLPADATDEYVKIGESTAIESMKKFCQAIVDIFPEEYLRSPTTKDISRLLYVGEKRGFPGMLDRSGSPTIILEAVADYDLCIRHAYFGMPGTNNDINVLESSKFFFNLAQGIALPVHYIIQGMKYNMGYYLADGIYPKWSTLVQTIQKPMDPKRKYFAMRQEACRKDIERAFGVLQSRFAMKGPVRFWDKGDLHNIITTCIILHNMIIEDEHDLDAPIHVGSEPLLPEVEVIKDDLAVSRISRSI